MQGNNQRWCDSDVSWVQVNISSSSESDSESESTSSKKRRLLSSDTADPDVPFMSDDRVRGCIDVQQPKTLMRRKERHSVSIPCSFNISSCQLTPQLKQLTLEISWYVFRKDFHYQIDLSNQQLKYKLEHHDLKISSLSKADCGVYYCAAALLEVTHSGAQAIGQGTTLKVSERGLNFPQTLLLTLLVLLSVYSLLVLGILISIKTGQFNSVVKRRWSKTNKKEDSASQVIFSGVVQELCKRNLSGDKFQARYKVSQDKSKGLQNMNHCEDIYQNLDE